MELCKKTFHVKKRDCAELQCCVCKQNYSDWVIPRSLPCGHSVCSVCISQIVLHRKSCPECRTPFQEDTAQDLPVNHSIQRLSRVLNFKGPDHDGNLQLEFPITFQHSRKQENAGKCPNHGLCMFFMCLRCLVPVCRNCLVQDHLDFPFGQCFIKPLVVAIEDILISWTRVTERYIEEAQLKHDELLYIQNILKMIEKIQETLDLYATRIKQVRVLNGDVVGEINTWKSILDALRTCHRNLKNCSSSEEIKSLLLRVATVHADHMSLKEEGKQELMLNSLKSLTEIMDLTKLLDTGRPIYAVNGGTDGHARWAFVTRKHQRVLLYSLKDGQHPQDGFCIPYDLVREKIPLDSPHVFFEISFDGEDRGHVYVRMFGDTPRSRQTVLLCSGEMGPSYKNTCFYKAAHYRNGCYLISGGDYENNDGSGGHAIVDGIISGEPYLHEVIAGLFVSWPSHEYWHLGSFDIYLNDTPGIYDHSAHGAVEEGLEILKEAALVTPVTRTCVSDCGLVVPIK
ncbi:uncharacterized protein LOC135215666 [Macrobrachium nipponense]|uniref:uncharacterized protein LOC135215666 n=1 Tax=Macrobrachium nipponense TaxID=159736 RepID=UPI0030C8BCA7